jgi:outer membrane protein assembly factor BamB
MRSTRRIAILLLTTVTAAWATHRSADGKSVAQARTIDDAGPVLVRGTEPQAHSTVSSSWPGFRGPNRDGVIREPIRVSWDGLAPMWKRPVGGGRSSFAVAGSRAFTIEQRLRDEVVVAYDVMTGRELWTNSWPERFSQWMGGGEGPRATPAWADGLVFALGASGELRALDAVSGRMIWRTNILEDAGAKNLTWGMAASPLIAGDAVIVLPGGPEGRSIAAYDRRTGRRLWTALDDGQAYVSPMQVTLLGAPQLLVVSATRLVGLSPDRRDVLWEFPWKTDHDASAAQPIVIGDNRVFYSSGFGAGAVVVELTRAGDRFEVRQIWRNIRMKNRQSSSVLHQGHIYGLDEGILACVDASTGGLKWKGGRYGHGQVLLAGEHLVITTEDGELVLVAPTPERLQELARVPAIDGETWNVPAFADGVLLVRNTKEMAAFDLRPEANQIGPKE